MNYLPEPEDHEINEPIDPVTQECLLQLDRGQYIQLRPSQRMKVVVSDGMLVVKRFPQSGQHTAWCYPGSKMELLAGKTVELQAVDAACRYQLVKVEPNSNEEPMEARLYR